jgi:hypothetical protein
MLFAATQRRAAPRLRDLVVPGSSLGGGRPKANVRDADGSLWIAKFPSRDDRRLDVGAWESVYARLARQAGIEVPEHRLLAVRGKGRGRTFLVRRFDRDAAGGLRLYVSAMTLADRRDGELASNPDIAQAVSRVGAAGTVGVDLAQLFRRLVFNVVAGNRDDHLRTAAPWSRLPHGTIVQELGLWRGLESSRKHQACGLRVGLARPGPRREEGGRCDAPQGAVRARLRPGRRARRAGGCPGAGSGRASISR